MCGVVNCGVVWWCGVMWWWWWCDGGGVVRCGVCVIVYVNMFSFMSYLFVAQM